MRISPLPVVAAGAVAGIVAAFAFVHRNVLLYSACGIIIIIVLWLCLMMACQPRFPSQDERDMDTLATYNAERGRGIVHTPEWDEQMTSLKAACAARQHQDMLDEGWTRTGDGRYVRHQFRHGKPARRTP